MGLGYFVISILGCADGGSACTPVATLPAQYVSQAQCNAATGAALMENSSFDFPTLVARCRAARPAAADAAKRSQQSARRG